MLNISNYQRKANQNYNEVSPHSGQNGHLQKVYNKMLERVWRKGTPPREYKLVGRTVWRFLKKLKIELPYDQAVPLLCIRRKLFTAALFIIAKTWRQPKCPLTDEWIKMWYTHNNGISLSHNKMK